MDMQALTPETASQPREAETATANVSREGGTVSFQVGGNTKIPSDGTPHKVMVFRENYPFKPEYIAVPRLVSFAYLQAVVVNPLTGATLLPGKANIFRDNTFVGNVQLENVSPGQEYKLNLGIDERLKIERELVERQVDKKLIGKQRRMSYAYRLNVTNLHQVQVHLTLKEQLPVSRNEQIKVRLTLTNPKIVAGEMGLLEWIMSLPAASKARVILPVCCRTSSRFSSRRFRYLIPASCQLSYHVRSITLIRVGAGSPIIFAKNGQSHKPAPAIVLWAINRT